METLDGLCSGQLSLEELPNTSPRSIVFYMCTAYTDFIQERRVLQQVAYPQLVEYCKVNYGLQFQMVDLKLGIENVVWEDMDFGNTFDYIRDKYSLSSADCCPIILLGQKYGLPLLPKRIPNAIFQQLRDTLRANRNSITKHYAILDKWYRRDENNINESEYVLVNVAEKLPNLHFSAPSELKQAAEKEWMLVRQLLSQIMKIGFAICLRQGKIDEELIYNILTYELESSITYMLHYSQERDFQPLIFLREIIDLKNYLYAEKAIDYTDCEYDEHGEKPTFDKEVAGLLNELKTRLTNYYPITNAPFKVLWRFDDGIDKDLHQEYLNDFCQAFVSSAKQAIDCRAAGKLVFNKSNFLNLFDEAWTNINMVLTIHHIANCREDAVHKVINYVMNSESQATLVLHGSTDDAITPIVAKTFVELHAIIEEKSLAQFILIPRIYSKPTKLSTALNSLHQQIKYLVADLPNQCPQNMQELVDNLPFEMAFVFLLAGTERLFMENDEPVPVNLLSACLPPNVKLIVTATVEPAHDTFLLSLSVAKLQPPDYMNFFSNQLKDRDRDLTQEQWSAVQNISPSIRNLFHASLILQQLCKWCSFETFTVRALPSSTAEAFCNIFDSAERRYGKMLIARIASFITASQNGLMDVEVEDILSMDDGVLQELKIEPGSCSVARFPASLWLLIKNDLSILLSEISSQGYFVNFWLNSDVETYVRLRYFHDKEVMNSIHDIMADYFLGVWHGTPKPFLVNRENESLIAIDRLLPSQQIVYRSGPNVYPNVRQYSQLAEHLQNSGRVEELDKIVLFNYEWLYYKAKSLGLRAVLRDFEIAHSTMESGLVEETLRKNSSLLNADLNNMATELSGNLISYSYLYSNIRTLIHQCDTAGSYHNAFLPTFPYSKFPGSALQSTVVCPSELRSMILDNSNGALFIQLDSDSKLYHYDLNSAELHSEVTLSMGELHVSRNFKFALVLDSKYHRTIKVHHMQDGSYVDQIVPINWIDTLPFEEKYTFKIKSLDVGESIVAIIIASRTSYIVAVDLISCKPRHIFRTDKCATLLKLTFDDKYLFTSAGEQLLGFSMETGQQMAAFDLLAKPRKMTFSPDSTRAFIICEGEQRVVVLHLNDSSVEMSYKIVFDNSLSSDIVQDVKLAQNKDIFLVRAEKNILIYDIAREAIITHLKRPTEIPNDFKLPNSDYVRLNFTEADFAFEDKLVVTSIFRDVLLWNIADGRLVNRLHAPVGIITKLLVDKERNGIIGYIGHSREIHFWNVNGAFNDNAVIDALTDSIAAIRVTHDVSKVLAICEASDEMGLIDLDTGYLTDLYTHEGQVKTCSISSCGKYAMVAIKPKRPNTANIVWSLQNRHILLEYGSTSGHYVAFHSGSNFIHIYQEAISFEEPHLITVINCTEDEARINTTNAKIQHILNKPFLTSDDKALVMLSATDYVEKKAFYTSPTIFIWYTANGMMQYVGPNTLSNFTHVRRILEVHPLLGCDSIVAVLYSTEEPDIALEDPNSQPLKLSVLLFDVQKVNVVKIAQDILPRSVPPTHMTFSLHGDLVVTANCNLYSITLGCHVGKLASQEMQFRGFALNDSVYIISQGQHVYAFSLPEGKQIGKVDVHDVITCLTMSADNRTIIIGCRNGNILSYKIVHSGIEDVEQVVQTIASRRALNKDRSRTWDRLASDNTDGNYSRPPSISANQRKADLQEYLANTTSGLSRARTCVLM